MTSRAKTYSHLLSFVRQGSITYWLITSCSIGTELSDKEIGTMNSAVVLLASFAFGVQAADGTIFCHGFDGPVDAETDHYWPFDDSADDIQLGENGTIIGDAGFVEGVPGRPSDRAIELDGSTQRVDIPLTVGTSLAGLTQVSVSAFVFFNAIGETGNYDVVLMLRRSAGGPHQLLARVFDDGSFGVSSRPNASDSQATVGTASGLLSSGQWHHIAAAINVTQRTIKLFVDGKLINNADVSALWGSGSSFDGVTSHASFGSDPSSATIHWLNGRVNDVRLYHRELDDTEVAQLDRWASLCPNR